MLKLYHLGAESTHQNGAMLSEMAVGEENQESGSTVITDFLFSFLWILFCDFI